MIPIVTDEFKGLERGIEDLEIRGQAKTNQITCIFKIGQNTGKSSGE